MSTLFRKVLTSIIATDGHVFLSIEHHFLYILCLLSYLFDLLWPTVSLLLSLFKFKLRVIKKIKFFISNIHKQGYEIEEKLQEIQVNNDVVEELKES